MIGQVYIPGINWLLLAGVVLLVLGFQSSSNLAAAYGIAVSGTMAITTVLATIVARRRWGWPPALVLAAFGTSSPSTSLFWPPIHSRSSLAAGFRSSWPRPCSS